MEFNNQGNIRPQSSPRIPHSSGYGFLAEQTHLGGHMIPNMSRNQQLFPNNYLQSQPNPLCPPGQTVYSHDVNAIVLREMEKRRIREEIIMSEMLMRRELAAEVRRDLFFERQLALSQIGSDGVRYGLPPVGESYSSTSLLLPGITLENKIAPFVDGRERLVNNDVPFQSGTPGLRITETESAEEASDEKRQLNLLAKPSANSSGKKRKAKDRVPTTEINEPSSDIVFKKRAKEEWKCELCHISCSCERSLKDHLIGKKHTKQVAATARGGKNYTIGLLSVNAEI